MSRSLLHDWEPSIEKLSVEMSKIAEDIYNTAYARGKNYSHSYTTEVLYNIRKEIMKLDDINPDYPMDRTIHLSRNEVLQIIDKYKEECEVEDGNDR